jgi:hypothetical protein
MVNHFYFYAVDDDCGPFFLKFCSYFPYTARLCINGNEYAKRQATKAGIDFTPLDNGFAAVSDVAGVQAICDGLTEPVIDALLRKWLARLPHPCSPADRDAGYRYEVSVLQGRVLPDPDARQTRLGADLLRTDHPGQPRHRPVLIKSASSSTGKSAATPPGCSAPGSSPRPSPRACTSTTSTAGSSNTTRRQGTPHRNHHQRHRLRHRETADQPPRTTGDRLLRQPTPAPRPTTQPRPHRRRRSAGRHHRTRHHRHRPAHPRTCDSPIHASKPCSPRYAYSVCCPAVSLTATCAPTSRPNSDYHPST